MISDHGFCDFGDSEVQTLPEETPSGKLKGDHDKKAILITKNVSYKIDSLRDVREAIIKELDLDIE